LIRSAIVSGDEEWLSEDESLHWIGAKLAEVVESYRIGIKLGFLAINALAVGRVALSKDMKRHGKICATSLDLGSQPT
jgi:hypothetical protein